MLKRAESAFAVIILCAVVVLVGIAAITRAIGTPIVWSVEIAQLMFLWLCILAIDIALQEDRHFGLKIVQDNLPASVRKSVEILNLVVLILLLAFLIRYAWRNTVIMHIRHDGALQIPGSLYHASMVVGFALMLRTLSVKLYRCLSRETA